MEKQYAKAGTHHPSFSISIRQCLITQKKKKQKKTESKGATEIDELRTYTITKKGILFYLHKSSQMLQVLEQQRFVILPPEFLTEILVVFKHH